MITLPFNVIATIRFNFHYLPFWKAIRLPIILYNKVKFVHTNGDLLIRDDVTFKMIQIGAHGSDMFSERITIIDINGHLVFNGSNIRIGHGSLIRVDKDANLIFNNNSILGANNLIFCTKNIVFEENALFSWDCQIMDSDTHHIKNMEDGMVYECTKPIYIGKDCWIGNHVIINKGTILPEGIIVSSFSLCNKDYRFLDKFSIVGGIPAKLLSTNKQRVD